MNFVRNLFLLAIAAVLLLFGIGGGASMDGGAVILLLPVIFAVSLWGFVIYKRGGLPPA